MLFNDLRPQWENAFDEEKGDERVILIPLSARLKNVSVNYECAERYRVTGDARYLTVNTLLCFKTNLKTDDSCFFFMSIVPSPDYLEELDFDVSQNRYFQRDPLFDGQVLYHNLSLSFVNGWEYREGVITNYHYIRDPLDDGASKTRSGGGTTCFEVWTVVAEDFYYRANGGTPVYNYTRYTFTSSLFCVSNGGNQSAIWWLEPNDPGGSSEGGGGYNPPISLSDNLKKIAKEVEMSQNQVTRLNTALNTFIEEGCMQKALYDALVRKNVKLDFGMKTGTAPGGYYPNTKKITFNDDANITSETLREELFHAWQDAYYFDGIWQYRETGKVNIEFEAKVFKDIIESPDTPCCWAFGEAENFPENLSTEYSLWIYDIRESTISLQDTDYQKWLNLFNQYNTEYSSPTHHNLSAPNAIRHLISQSNCY